MTLGDRASSERMALVLLTGPCQGSPMPLVPRQLLIGGLVIGGALVYLGVAVAGSEWTYYTDVDQYVAHAMTSGERVRLHGRVRIEGTDTRTGGRFAAFELLGASSSIRVEYRGLIPDLFGPDRDVLVEGARDRWGVFQADRLLTKCAGKYDPQPRAGLGTERRP